MFELNCMYGQVFNNFVVFFLPTIETVAPILRNGVSKIYHIPVQ